MPDQPLNAHVARALALYRAYCDAYAEQLLRRADAVFDVVVTRADEEHTMLWGEPRRRSDPQDRRWRRVEYCPGCDARLALDPARRSRSCTRCGYQSDGDDVCG